jgi:hypothetical protein
MSPEDELSCYTLSLRDATFIHQHVVDAIAAQNADAQTKPIKITFALLGLYLHVEKQVSGRQVQLIHIRLAKSKASWPACPLPNHRGAISAVDVLAVPPGPERDKAIDAWCESVWAAFHESRQTIVDLLRERGIA